jgi:beta-lactamase regulating signal transducer with metallopeptidase domain
MVDWIAAAALNGILNGMVAGLALAAALWLALRLLARTNAATRHAAWLAALAAILLLPVLMMGLPATADSAASSGRDSLATVPAPGGWAMWALAVWLAIAAAMLSRLVWSYFSLRGIKNRSVNLTAWQPQFEELLRTCGVRRRVQLRTSAEVRVPMAAGLFNPVILIPESLADRLSDDESRQVLAHELAHLRRWDDWIQLAQKLAEAVWFFHPAVWWIGRKLGLEREIACDDWVVSVTGAARPYAVCLTRLVELGAFGHGPRLAHGALPRKGQISHRIESLMRRDRAASHRFSGAAAFAGASVLGLALLAAAHVTPIAVAGPALAALPSAVAPIPAVELAYAKPVRAPRPVARPKSAPAERMVVVEQVAVVQSGNFAATYCVFYVGEGKKAGEPSPVRGWFAVWWSRPARLSISLGQS